jgi:3-oxoisoapionate decarboxylase
LDHPSRKDTLEGASTMPARIGVNLLSIAANRWTAFQYLDYLAKLQVQEAQFNGNTIGVPPTDEAGLRKIRAYAEQLGIALPAYLDGCICPSSSAFNPRLGTIEEQVPRNLNVARILGASAMKVELGGPKERPGIERHIENTIRTMRSLRSRVLDSGVKLALENHGDLQARELKTIIDEAGADIVGVLLDSANPPYSLLEDPHLTLEVLGPFALFSHVRDTAVWRTPEGVATRWVRLGEGNVDMAGWIRKFARMHPAKAIGLEIIVSPEPNVIRYLDPAVWKDFAKMPAWEFSRFLAYAEKGRPVPAVPLPPGRTQGQQQCEDLEVSIRFVREALRDA